MKLECAGNANVVVSHSLTGAFIFKSRAKKKKYEIDITWNKIYEISIFRSEALKEPKNQLLTYFKFITCCQYVCAHDAVHVSTQL